VFGALISLDILSKSMSAIPMDFNKPLAKDFPQAIPPVKATFITFIMVNFINCVLLKGLKLMIG